MILIIIVNIKLNFHYVPKTVLSTLHGIYVVNLYHNPMRNVLFMDEKLCLERVMDLSKFKQLVSEGVTVEVGRLRYRI